MMQTLYDFVFVNLSIRDDQSTAVSVHLATPLMNN